MPPQENQITPSPPVAPVNESHFPKKTIWIMAIAMLLVAGGVSAAVFNGYLHLSPQTLLTANQTQQQASDTLVQAPTDSSQLPSIPPETKTVVADGRFALIPAKRQPVVISGNNIFDPEYGLNISYPAGWNAVLDKTYTNTDTQTLYLQRGGVKLTLQPSVFWYSSLAASYSYDKLHKKVDTVFKQKPLGDGTLLMVGTESKDAYFADIFWGYQYPDGTWQVVTNILETTGLSEAYIDQFKQKGVPVDGYLTIEEAKTFADSVYASVTIGPRKVRNLGRITELIRTAGALDIQEEYHGGIPRTATMPSTVPAATYAFPTHNYNGTAQGVPYGWVDNSKEGGYCIYTRLESGSPAEYYMISNVKRSQDAYSMSRGSYVTKPPTDMEECNV